MFAFGPQTIDAIVLAATYADRVSHLIVVNGTARRMWAPDYPMGTPREAFDAAEEVMFEPDAVERGRGGPTDHASGYPRSRAS